MSTRYTLDRREVAPRFTSCPEPCPIPEAPVLPAQVGNVPSSQARSPTFDSRVLPRRSPTHLVRRLNRTSSKVMPPSFATNPLQIVPRRGVEPRPPAFQTSARHHESFRGKVAGLVVPPPISSIWFSKSRRSYRRLWAARESNPAMRSKNPLCYRQHLRPNFQLRYSCRRSGSNRLKPV